MLLIFFYTQQSATTPILSWSPSAAYNPNRYRRISPVWGGEKIKECIPSSKETTTQEDVTLSVSAIAECNKSCERLEDGQSVVQFANGTRKETLMCGKVSQSPYRHSFSYCLECSSTPTYYPMPSYLDPNGGIIYAQ